MGLKTWAKTKLLQGYLRELKEKLMGHKARTWLEGLLVAVGIGLLGYAAENAALLFGADRSTLYAGLAASALMAAKGYVAARYATPPDVQERVRKIQTGELPGLRAEEMRRMDTGRPVFFEEGDGEPKPIPPPTPDKP
jgi:hypothetical protein